MRAVLAPQVDAHVALRPAWPAGGRRARLRAPPEEVWKLLYDPARFPEWWAGIAAVEAGEAA